MSCTCAWQSGERSHWGQLSRLVHCEGERTHHWRFGIHIIDQISSLRCESRTHDVGSCQHKFNGPSVHLHLLHHARVWNIQQKKNYKKKTTDCSVWNVYLLYDDNWSSCNKWMRCQDHISMYLDIKAMVRAKQNACKRPITKSLGLSKVRTMAKDFQCIQQVQHLVCERRNFLHWWRSRNVGM